MRPKLLTIALVALIAAVVWCSARVRVSAPAPSSPDSLPLPLVGPVGAEAPGDVRLIDARACARRVVGRELLAGRLTVPEAAAVFGWLDRQHPALSASMIETANRAMAGGSPVGSELSAARATRGSGCASAPPDTLGTSPGGSARSERRRSRRPWTTGSSGRGSAARRGSCRRSMRMAAGLSSSGRGRYPSARRRRSTPSTPPTSGWSTASN